MATGVLFDAVYARARRGLQAEGQAAVFYDVLLTLRLPNFQQPFCAKIWCILGGPNLLYLSRPFKLYY